MNEAISNDQNELGTFAKISNVFFAPQKTFASIDRKPDWIIPLAIVLIITLLFTVVIMPIAIPEQMSKQRAKMEERGMSPEEIDRAMEIGEKAGKIAGPISAVVVSILFLLVISGILMFVGNIILGGKTSFKKLFSVVCYSSLIGSLNQLILLLIIPFKKTMDVHFSLAAFMSSDSSETMLYQLLKKIDLFTIWEIIVMGIGVAVIYKFTTKKSIGMVASLYVIYIILSLVWRSIF